MNKTKLIIISGMSGTGKSTTAKSLSEQLSQQKLPHVYLHEECAMHPIRQNEFAIGDFRVHEDLEKNVEEIYWRWEELVKRILAEGRVYILEACLYENICRYFLEADYPEEKITLFYQNLMKILASVHPHIVLLLSSNVQNTLEAMYEIRGQWWKDLILDTHDNMYCQNRGLVNTEAVYSVYDQYQALSEKAFDLYQGAKTKLVTSEGDWSLYRSQLMQDLGMDYTPLPEMPIENPEDYCGNYAISYDADISFIIKVKNGEVYCTSFWPYMALRALESDVFTFAAFPITLEFLRDKKHQVESVFVKGNYDWDIMGKKLLRIQDV